MLLTPALVQADSPEKRGMFVEQIQRHQKAAAWLDYLHRTAQQDRETATAA
jgi:hypothetical protein